MVKQGSAIAANEKGIKQFLLWSMIFALLFFLLVADPSKYYFLNDDFVHIPLAAKNNFIYDSLLRPVSDLTLWIDNRIWGKNAFGYHLTNTIVHVINTFLVWALARRFFKRYSDRESAYLKSGLAAILFLVYAFHSESIFWIIGRGGSLSTLFFLLSCRFYMDRRYSLWYFLLCLLFFGIGLFAYESIFVFPAIVFFISVADVSSKSVKWKREWAYPFSVILFFIFFLLYRKAITGTLTGDYELQTILQFDFPRLLYNYNTLLARNILPPMHESKWFLSWYIVIAILSITALLIIIRKKKAKTFLWLMLACFLVSLLPPVSLGIDTHDSESERFIYLPSVFFILLLIEIISQLVARTKLFAGIVLLIVVWNGFFLFQSASSYRFAGVVVKRSLDFMNTKTSLNTMHVINLPRQYKGALMFRSGFDEAVRWIDNDCIFNHIDTLSSFEYIKKPAAFFVEEQDIRKGLETMKASPVGTNSREALQISLPGKTFSFAPGKDIILLWTDSSLIRIK